MGEYMTAPQAPSFAERVANVERYLSEAVNDSITQTPADGDFAALLDCIREQQGALRHVIEDEPNGIPRASSACREVVHAVLAKYALP